MNLAPRYILDKPTRYTAFAPQPQEKGHEPIRPRDAVQKFPDNLVRRHIAKVNRGGVVRASGFPKDEQFQVRFHECDLISSFEGSTYE
jgi:hypothetical protein